MRQIFHHYSHLIITCGNKMLVLSHHTKCHNSHSALRTFSSLKHSDLFTEPNYLKLVVVPDVSDTFSRFLILEYLIFLLAFIYCCYFSLRSFHLSFESLRIMIEFLCIVKSLSQISNSFSVPFSQSSRKTLFITKSFHQLFSSPFSDWTFA